MRPAVPGGLRHRRGGGARPGVHALRFQEQGARWLHMVDLDGAKERQAQKRQLIFDVVEKTNLYVEVGGGIRDMDTVEHYLNQGVSV